MHNLHVDHDQTRLYTVYIKGTYIVSRLSLKLYELLVLPVTFRKLLTPLSLLSSIIRRNEMRISLYNIGISPCAELCVPN
jgi:hypothetical protein